MRSFQYHRAKSVADAVAVLGPTARAMAGGTELVNWLKDGLATPDTIVDISRLGLGVIRRDGAVIRIGALTRLANIVQDPLVRSEAPALVEAVEAAASPQIRHMGTIGGNLLQQTRCPYFRIPAGPGGNLPCHLRSPGSGCAAKSGDRRAAAIVGGGDCIAAHPSDLAVALACLDARLSIAGPNGARSIPVGALYGTPGTFAIDPSELIVEVIVPVSDTSRSSRFLKLRDRAAFDFALVSGAAATDGRSWRVVLGALSWGPWRCALAEGRLSPTPAATEVEAAVRAELATVAGANDKVALATRLAVKLVTGGRG